MFENFDDLYDQFFNRGGKGKSNAGDNKHLDKMKNLLNKLNNFDDIGPMGFNPHESELGEPDEVTTYTENGYSFEKKIWNLESGQLVKESMISSPFDDEDKGGQSLEDQLKLAIDEERYEDAAALSQKIKDKEEETKK